MLKNFRTLDLAIEFYHASRNVRVKGSFRNQLQRAALSIPLNLSEGRGKPTRKDQLRYFHIAMGSVRECQTLLRLVHLESTDSWRLLDKVAASLYRLIERAA